MKKKTFREGGKNIYMSFMKDIAHAEATMVLKTNILNISKILRTLKGNATLKQLCSI